MGRLWLGISVPAERSSDAPLATAVEAVLRA